jgi:hypothetical protein
MVAISSQAKNTVTLCRQHRLEFRQSRGSIKSGFIWHQFLPVTVTHASAEIETRMKALGAAVGRPWRKEQKLACLSVRPSAGGDLPR